MKALLKSLFGTKELTPMEKKLRLDKAMNQLFMNEEMVKGLEMQGHPKAKKARARWDKMKKGIESKMYEMGFTCPDCKLTTYNKEDIRYRHCGRCNKYF